MKPFYCRQGSKWRYTSGLLSLIPAHKTYVEAFIGGGAVFWAKEPSEHEVLNDLDSQLIQDYLNLQNASTDVSKYPIIPGLRKKEAFLEKKGKTREERITEALIRRCNGYMGTYVEDKVYKPSTHQSKFNNIADYKARLKDVDILNQDYRKVLKKYDSNDTFFFLDPPYEKSIGLDYAAGSENFDYEEMVRVLKGLRGKFLVTINDSPYIREVFSDFRIYPYNVSKVSYGRSARDELLITNYVLPRAWKKELVGSGTPKEDEGAIEEQARQIMSQLREQLQRPGHMLGDVLRRYATEREGQDEFDYKTPSFLASSGEEFVRTPESTISPITRTPPVQTRQTTPREYVYEPPADAYGTPPQQIVSRRAAVEPPTPKRVGRGLKDELKRLMDELELIEDESMTDEERWDIVVSVFERVLSRFPEEMDLTSMAEIVRTRKGFVFRPKNVLMKVLERHYGEFYGSGMTRRKRILKKYDLKEDGYSVEELADVTGVPEETLQEVYNRGIGAYKTNPRSVRLKGSYRKNVDAPMSQKLSKEQWAMARVYSFLDGNPKHDTDLRGSGFTCDDYLKQARAKARKAGYDASAVSLAEDGTHKLCIAHDGKKTCFGRAGYGDFLIWTRLEREGKVPVGTAQQKRRVFRKSHSAIKGDWKSNPYSKNNLALNILW